MQLVLFIPWIGSNQVLPFQARVELEAMTKKECSSFSKAPASLEPPITLFSVLSRKLVGGLTPLKMCSRCILHTQPTGQHTHTHTYIYHHHHVAPPARISLTVSRHFSPIIHRLRQVFWVTSRVLTQLLYVGSCWSSHSCTSMCGGPQEYIAYELVLASPAVSCVSGSSNLYSFCDGGQVSV